MTTYQRIFGTGPRGLAFGLISLALAIWLHTDLALAPLHGAPVVGFVALGIGTMITLSIVVWSLKALPPDKRGRDLVKAGPFAHVRHPLYAAFLVGFDMGLAIYMDGWIFLLWAVLQYPLWHLNITGEERLMEQEFGQDYLDYCETTGRFLPRIVRPPESDVPPL